MTQAARDDRETALYARTLTDGPEGPARAIDTPPDPGLDQGAASYYYYTQEQVGPGPEDIQWTPITDPAEIAALDSALLRGNDPPYDLWVDYEVWADQSPAAHGQGSYIPAQEMPLDDLAPTRIDQTAYYAWEQTGLQPGDGQRYDVTDPVVLAAYAEAHPEPSGVEITYPAASYEEALVPAPAPSQDLAPDAALDRDLTPALDL